MKEIKRILLALIFVFLYQISFAGEGMWIPLLIKALEGDMQALGMKMSAEDIYDVNRGSLKDAIVRFGGGCTGEIISPMGLLLTNHHCGRSRIQAHSSLDHNYLEDGFWAKSFEEELPNPGLSVTFLVRMEDVTEKVKLGLTDDMDSRTRQSVIDKNIAQLKKEAQIMEYEKVEIKPFFKGNHYYMLVTVTYTDVRLVGAPPSSIGSFGHDTDNWVWPRHSGDFSLFRVYANADNLPAEFSENNVPFKPKHYLPISLDGVQAEDFTLVFGFPGRTNEYLPSHAVEQIMNVVDPARIAVRDRALNVLNAAMRADPEVKIQYTSKQARISNAWKKWQGEVLGLKKTNAVLKKQKMEQKFMKRVKSNGQWEEKYGMILNDFRRLYTEIHPYAEANAYYSEVMRVNVELFRVTSVLKRLADAWENQGNEGYEAFKVRVVSFFNGFYKDYRPEIDQKVFASVMEIFVEKVPHSYVPYDLLKMILDAGGDLSEVSDQIYGNTFITDRDRMMSILEKSPSDVMKAIQNDKAYQLSSSLAQAYAEKVSAKYNELNEEITTLQRKYMAALMEVFPKENFYPDANGTLRVTYGKVQGYQPRDAVRYEHITYLEGVMEKYVPGDYEFDVPEKLLDLYEDKDYSQYGVNGKMPVCFIGSNHTSGGNSGSPVIDAYGNLIGLNFDRVWEGTMSDINYDLSICRNIMVDIRYVLFLTDKLGGASRLIEEMTLVNPKQSIQKENKKINPNFEKREIKPKVRRDIKIKSKKN